ncbi:MAG TPA: uroporphyrinogen-III C-methyltransferase [Gammaproteobacteria bacterium]|nr:uroporphyrinogen-III C-methyltransferase [Gammaproteobacteria bacterium]
MDFLPICMNVRGQQCLVVGGGEVALRKIQLLLNAGADVQVIAPVVCETVARLIEQGKIHWISRIFEEKDIEEKCLIISATNQREVNRRVSVLAKKQNIPVNVVDAPDLCRFIVPSIIDRSPIIVAVSSGGSSPVLARLLRARLETLIPASYGRLAKLLEGFRQQVKSRFSSSLERRRFWESILQGPVSELMFAGQETQAKSYLEQALAKGEALTDGQGEVYLVGAGPGDPDLLTFRALRLLQQADVIVYDRLVSEPILALARKDAERIYVGKQKSDHTLPQDDINRILLALAKDGKRVLRLKGGDPFIFGRGGEEIELLMEEGIPFQVVPGITAAAGCAAYAGIPLTHRDYAQSVVFATGHLKDNSINLNWPALIQGNQTLVFYMGLTGLVTICKKLIEHGMKKETPIALVEKGTTPDQQIHIGTLLSLPESLRQLKVKPPTLIIVGDVVNLHKKLAWFKPDNS